LSSHKVILNYKNFLSKKFKKFFERKFDFIIKNIKIKKNYILIKKKMTLLTEEQRAKLAEA
jgi:hypothetical protein